MPRHAIPKRSRAFTLVEMIALIVFLIVLIGHVVINMAVTICDFGRSSARQGQFVKIESAIMAYRSSYRNQLPGYFSEEDLAHLNSPRLSDYQSLSGIQNLMISLMGPFAIEGAINYRPYWLDTGKIQLELDLSHFENLTNDYGSYFSPSSQELRYVKLNPRSSENEMMPVLADIHTGVPLLYYRGAGDEERPVTRGRKGGRFLWESNQRWYATSAITTEFGKYKQATRSLLGGENNDLDQAELLAWFFVDTRWSDFHAAERANHPTRRFKGDAFLVNAGDDGIYFSRDTLKVDHPGRPPRTKIEHSIELQQFDDLVQEIP